MSEIDFTTATAEELAAIEPGDFLRMVKAMSDRDLRALMEGPNRAAIVDAIFGRMPELFRADRAGSTTATTHWSITGGAGEAADEWTVRFADGACTSVPGHDGDAAVSLSMAATDFIKIVTKSGNPMLMVMTGKLRIRGDLGLAARIGSFFDAPRS